MNRNPERFLLVGDALSMLPLKITFERIDVNHALRAHIEAKAIILREAVLQVSSIQVSITETKGASDERYRARVELVRGRNRRLTSQAGHAADAYRCLNEAFSSMHRQLQEELEDESGRRGRRSPVETLAPLGRRNPSSTELFSVSRS